MQGLNGQWLEQNKTDFCILRAVLVFNISGHTRKLHYNITTGSPQIAYNIFFFDLSLNIIFMIHNIIKSLTKLKINVIKGIYILCEAYLRFF